MIDETNRAGAPRWLAACNLLVAAVIALAAFGAVPAGGAAVWVPGAALIALLLASAVGLARRTRWARPFTRVTALALLAAGLVVTAMLVLGMAFSRAVGAYAAGPGPLLFTLAVLLVLPYGVLYPAGVLLWLESERRRTG